MSSDSEGCRLPSFTDDLETILVLHDSETGNVLDANQAAEAAYGYSVEALRGSEVGFLSADPSEYSTETAREVIQAASEGHPQRFEWKIKRASGELRWIDVSLKRISIHETDCVLAEVTDITEVKHQTERVELLHRIIRHNLRNQMNVVKGYAEQLRGALEPEPEGEKAEMISTCSDDLLSMAELVTDLANLAAKDAADFRTVQVEQVIEQVTADLAEAHPDAEFVVDAETQVELSSDGSLRLAIEQALENAVVHHDGTPRVTVRTTVEDIGSRAVVRILDDGPQIPESELVVIDSAMERSPTRHGTGMGIFLMWWCAESLGGKLEISPGDDRGNVVTFTLPVIADEQDVRENTVSGAESGG